MKIARYLPAFAWFTLSFYLLTLPGSELPKIKWFDALHGDKIVHIGMFAVLVALWLFAAKQPAYKSLKTALYIGLAALVYGIAIEFVQDKFVPMRSFEVTDIAADAAGCFLPYCWLVLRMKSAEHA